MTPSALCILSSKSFDGNERSASVKTPKTSFSHSGGSGMGPSTMMSSGLFVMSNYTPCQAFVKHQRIIAIG